MTVPEHFTHLNGVRVQKYKHADRFNTLGREESEWLCMCLCVCVYEFVCAYLRGHLQQPLTMM